MFLNRADLAYYDTERALILRPSIAGLAGRLLTASRKAEEDFRGSEALDHVRRPHGRLLIETKNGLSVKSRFRSNSIMPGRNKAKKS